MYYFRPTDKQTFTYEIVLPPNSPIVSAQGKPYPSKSQAKQSAAFAACVLLREKGCLDEHLLPLNTAKAIPEGANARHSIDREKANSYPFRAKPSFWDVEDRPLPEEVYVTVLGYVAPEAMGRPYQPMCIITRDRVPDIPRFTVYADSGGNSEVYAITLNSPMTLDEVQLERLNVFTFRFFYDVFNKTFEIAPNIPYWIFPIKNVPVDKDSKIQDILDNDLIDVIMKWKEYEWNENTPGEFFVDRFMLHRQSRSRRFFSEEVVPELTPHSKIPPGACTAPGTPTIYDYSHFAKTKDIDFPRRDHNMKQPVLKASRVLHRINYLDPSTERDNTTVLLAYIVPSAYEMSCVSFWWPYH